MANLDTAVAVGEREGLTHPMTVILPSEQTGVFSTIGYAFNEPTAERTVHVDRFGGTVVSQYGYDDYGTLAKAVTHGIALHEGRHFGTVNMVLTTLFCLAVIASCITGPLMWWRRRPKGGASLGAPRGRMPAPPATAGSGCGGGRPGPSRTIRTCTARWPPSWPTSRSRTTCSPRTG